MGSDAKLPPGTQLCLGMVLTKLPAALPAPTTPVVFMALWGPFTVQGLNQRGNEAPPESATTPWSQQMLALQLTPPAPQLPNSVGSPCLEEGDGDIGQLPHA